MWRMLGTLVIVGAMAGCSAADGEREAHGAAGTQAATPAGLDEVSPGYDESPDGASPVPDEDLDDDALTALLRTRAATRDDGHCAATEVAVGLEGFDVSLGHRYSTIVVRNDGDRPCAVEGVPGIGVRGGWGSTFVPEVRASDVDVTGAPVAARRIVLAPGERAVADLEWTGALAGAESEAASLIVVQLAAGQVPAPVPADVAGEALDIGQFTTIELTPFMPPRR